MSENHGFAVGQKVVCTDEVCGDMVKVGLLVKGQTYTVANSDDGWSVFLEEVPGIQFNDRRFRAA